MPVRGALLRHRRSGSLSCRRERPSVRHITHGVKCPASAARAPGSRNSSPGPAQCALRRYRQCHSQFRPRTSTHDRAQLAVPTSQIDLCDRGVLLQCPCDVACTNSTDFIAVTSLCPAPTALIVQHLTFDISERRVPLQRPRDGLDPCVINPIV